jgi:hypothetical protein
MMLEPEISDESLEAAAGGNRAYTYLFFCTQVTCPQGIEVLRPEAGSGSAQQPRHAGNHSEGCKSHNNGKSEQCCGTGLFDEFRFIPSRSAKKGTIGFALNHGSEMFRLRQKKSSNCRS